MREAGETDGSEDELEDELEENPAAEPVVDMERLPLEPAVQANYAVVQAEGNDLFEQVLGRLINQQALAVDSLTLDPQHGYRGNLFIAGCTPYLATLELTLGAATGSEQPKGGDKLAAFRKIMTLTAQRYEIAYVIVDCAPSIGLLNSIIVNSCDYILPPVFPDTFSQQTVEGLIERVLPDNLLTLREQWLDYAQRGGQARRWYQDAEEFPFNVDRPRLLPFLMTNYRRYGQGICLSDARIIHGIKSFVDAPQHRKPWMVPYTAGGNVNTMLFWGFLKAGFGVIKDAQVLRVPLVKLQRRDIAQLGMRGRDVVNPHATMVQVDHIRQRYWSLVNWLRYKCENPKPLILPQCPPAAHHEEYPIAIADISDPETPAFLKALFVATARVLNQDRMEASRETPINRELCMPLPSALRHNHFGGYGTGSFGFPRAEEQVSNDGRCDIFIPNLDGGVIIECKRVKGDLLQTIDRSKQLPRANCSLCKTTES